MASAVGQGIPQGAIPSDLQLQQWAASALADPSISSADRRRYQEVMNAATNSALNGATSYNPQGTSAYSAPIPGAPDTGPATGGAGPSLMPDATRQWMDTGKTGGPIDKTDVSSTLTDFFKKKGGDIAIIVLGLLVIAAALWATLQKQDLILKTVKTGVTG